MQTLGADGGTTQKKKSKLLGDSFDFFFIKDEIREKL